MRVRSILNNFNKGFLIFGGGSINYSNRNYKMSVVLYVLRRIIIYAGFYYFYKINLLVITKFKFILIVSYDDTLNDRHIEEHR